DMNMKKPNPHNCGPGFFVCRSSVEFRLLTFPRWYEPDHVPRVKKPHRVSFSAQLIGLPLLFIQLTCSVHKLHEDVNGLLIDGVCQAFTVALSLELITFLKIFLA